jgi:ribonuclease J
MLVIPFGGCGEFGRNLTAYVLDGTMLLVDCGIQMPDDTTPGVDYLIPDFAPLLSRFGPPAAVLLTHGHEDHIGALGHLLQQLGSAVPVYGRPLTLRLCEKRLDRLAVSSELRNFRELWPEQSVTLGPADRPCFEVTPLAVPHSIPEACALLIKSLPAQKTQRRVLHTGDFKLDEIGQLEFPEPIDLVVGDSTNAGVPGRTGCEREVSTALFQLVADKGRPGRVAVSLFSSHIERIVHFAEACQSGGRRLCLLGRGLHDATAAAARAGVLTLPDNVLCDVDEASTLPPHKLALLCTGTQGEPGAALGRLVSALSASSRQAFGGRRLAAGDTVVLSARIIPGHERPVGRLIDRLLLSGIEVLVGGPYAVSGHGSSDDLREILRAARPRALLPVHGTQRQIRAHAALAEELGVQALRCQNGDVIALDEAIEVIDRLAAPALCVEGVTVGTVGSETLRQRQRMCNVGVVAVAASPGLPGRFVVKTLGISDAGPELEELCREAAGNAATAFASYEKGQKSAGSFDSGAALAIKRAVRNTFARRRGIKPAVLTVLAGPELGYDEQEDTSKEAIV